MMGYEKIDEMMEKPPSTWDIRIRSTCSKAPFVWQAGVVKDYEERSARRKRMYDRTLSGGNEGDYIRRIEVPFDEEFFVLSSKCFTGVLTYADEVRFDQMHNERRFEDNLVNDLVERGVDDDLGRDIARFVRECIHDAIDVGSRETLARLALASEVPGIGDTDHPTLLYRMLYDEEFYLRMCKITGIWSTNMQYIQEEPSGDEMSSSE